ncbi:MAG: glycoside hydrolase family 2 TIM barrel-domain containing protein, partial [Oscillospiraceae bacterium]|nr:glycoside hydrolase family 2 TIM barrel-domain containing protein [Oscillospiraceae bacterium]
MNYEQTNLAQKGAFKKLTALFLCILMVMSAVPSSLNVLAAGSSSLSGSSVVSNARLELSFNKNWKFNLGDVGGAQTKAFDNSTWKNVQLPNDFSISQDFTNDGTEVESGNLPGGTGWYRKMFTMPADYAGKEVILNFDGAYNNAYVYVNGQLVCENHYGYNSFSVNISDYIVCNGTTWNIVAVKVVSEMASSRWYPGAGLTRDVTMTIVNPVHVSRYGTKVTTPTATEASGTMNAVVTVQNESTSSATVTVINQILDATGTAIGQTGSTETIPASSSLDVSASISPSNITLWDIDNPYLYTLRTTVQDSAGNELDVYDTEFGFRTINWDATTGFSLNGTPVKIKGMCMHHDQGALGAAQEYDAIYRQVKILKDMGCNAIRTSHNIPSRVLLEVCNELGMLVMEEFFDGWDSPKNANSNDFSKYFSVNLESSNHVIGGSSSMTWAQFALTQAVKRDRNDPCIILWSCANELNHGSSSANYMTIAAQIDSWLAALDTTRPLTQGNNRSSIMDIDQYMDVIGGNYWPEAWENLKTAGTLTKPFVGTETVSAITTRGVYSYRGSDYDGGKLGNENYTLYSYDNSAVTWGNTAAYNWYYTAKNDWYSGEFVWTGFDYIGEPTPWYSSSAGTSTVPNSSYFGVIDTAGFPKDQFYLYRSWWQTKDTTLHLLPGTWDSSNLYLNNNYAYVNVYSNADHIELLLNGNVIARAQSTTNRT